jgi:hypothetical protein
LTNEDEGIMEEQVSAKEAIEAAKALNELMGLFKVCQDKVVELMPDFTAAAQGEHARWFKAIENVSDLNVDDAQGCLIVALSVLAQIKVKIKDTPAEEILKDIFKPQES